MWEAHFFLKLILCYAWDFLSQDCFFQAKHALFTPLGNNLLREDPEKILTVLSFIYLFI